MTGNELREWRKANNWSMAQMAVKLDIHPQTIWVNEQKEKVSEFIATTCRVFNAKTMEGKPCRK
jgi:transcriptional regulator with XRE-family HTH domain